MACNSEHKLLTVTDIRLQSKDTQFFCLDVLLHLLHPSTSKHTDLLKSKQGKNILGREKNRAMFLLAGGNRTRCFIVFAGVGWSEGWGGGVGY